MILKILTIILLAYKLTNLLFPEKFLKYWLKDLIQAEYKDIKTWKQFREKFLKDKLHVLIIVSELLCLTLLISLLFTKYVLLTCGIFLFRFIRDRVKKFYKDPYYIIDIQIDAIIFIIFTIILLINF